MDCDERFTKAHQVATLQYIGASNTEYPNGDADYDLAHKEGLVSAFLSYYAFLDANI